MSLVQSLSLANLVVLLLITALVVPWRRWLAGKSSPEAGPEQGDERLELAS